MRQSDLARPYIDAFERELETQLLTRYPGNDSLAQAVRYVMAAEGKRVRPTLCLMAAEAVSGDFRVALPGAVAIEFIHTYSLVHDDLPCMDDDDLRRGRPTAHKVFGEAVALLAGDALLTDAFAILTDNRGPVTTASAQVAMVHELAVAAGGSGMVLGQSLDLHWTARPGATHEDLDEIHLRKTGFLLGAAVAMGAAAGRATPDAGRRLREFGRLIGLAFQILDDVLDDTPSTGKTRGKDKSMGKLTYLSMMSRDEALAAADRFTTEARGLIADLGPRKDTLDRFVLGLLARDR